MSGWPFTKAWTVFFVLYGLSAIARSSDLGLAGMLGGLLGAFIATWLLQSFLGWLQRRWASFRSGGDGDEPDAAEDAPDPAD